MWLTRPIALAFLVLLVELGSRPLLQWATSGADGLPDRVLLVIAHPDDEAMFFVPIVTNAIKAGKQVDLLCMSSGNADGLGHRRTTELQAAARHLGIRRVSVVDEPSLQDGMDVEWAPSAVAAQLDARAPCDSSSAVVTFDLAGASGHPNHISTARGVLEWAVERSSNACGLAQVWQLRSVPVWRRYLGSAGALAEALPPPQAGSSRGGDLFLTADPRVAAEAMAAHASQLVWYRRLFLGLASYARASRLTRVWPLEGPS